MTRDCAAMVQPKHLPPAKYGDRVPLIFSGNGTSASYVVVEVVAGSSPVPVPTGSSNVVVARPARSNSVPLATPPKSTPSRTLPSSSYVEVDVFWATLMPYVVGVFSVRRSLSASYVARLT